MFLRFSFLPETLSLFLVHWCMPKFIRQLLKVHGQVGFGNRKVAAPFPSGLV